MKLKKIKTNLNMLEINNKNYYFSYETLIAIYDKTSNTLQLLNKDFSKTTSTHKTTIINEYGYNINIKQVDELTGDF